MAFTPLHIGWLPFTVTRCETGRCYRYVIQFFLVGVVTYDPFTVTLTTKHTRSLVEKREAIPIHYFYWQCDTNNHLDMNLNLTLLKNALLFYRSPFSTALQRSISSASTNHSMADG